MNDHRERFWRLGILLSPLASLTALGSCAATRSDAPAQAAEKWYIAVNKLEALEADDLTCRPQREQFRGEMAAGSALALFGQLLLGGDLGIEPDVSEMEFVTVEQDNRRAIVHVSGEMRGAVGARVQSEQVDERWLMVYEDEGWRWCGRRESLPESAGLIAFTSSLGDNREIFMSADGTGMVNLTDNPAWDALANISPDGDRIVFWSDREGSKIWIMNRDGSGLRRLSPQFIGVGASYTSPLWSPDDKLIAFFASEGTQGRAIYVMNPDGGDVRPFAENPQHRAIDPSDWSPDGKSIIASILDEEDDSDLVIFPAEGTMQWLLDGPEPDFGPRLSPDGGTVAFYSWRGGNSDIYLANADGSQLRNLTNHPSADAHPVWSPDGTKIAFSSDRDGNMEIYTINVTSGGLARLTYNDSDDFVDDWSA